MKTNSTKTSAHILGLTLALAVLGGASSSLKAGEIATGKGGATRLLELSGRLVTPKVELAASKPMSCAKCKDEYVTRVDRTARGANKTTITVANHLCGGCNNEWIVSGHGKAKISTAAHTCTSCGAASLACCSTSKGGVAATKGMEKKFEIAPLQQPDSKPEAK